MSKVLDYLGREVTALKRPETKEMGAVGLRDRWYEYPSAGLTPGRLAEIFRMADYGYPWWQAELFIEIEEKDTHVATVLQTRKMSVVGLERQVMPFSQDKGDREIAAFVDEKLNNIVNFEESLLDLLDALGKGYSVCEILWGINEQQQAIPKLLQWIHPRRVNFLMSMTPRILTEDNLADGVEPKPWQIIFHSYKARSGFVLRAGLLRELAFLYLLKIYALKDWSIFNEVFGMPLRVGRYDPSASPADRQALKEALINLGVDAAGIISKTTEIEFVESKYGSAQHNPYQTLLDWCNGEMSKAVLGQTLTTETTRTTGTYAAAKVHEEVRQDLLEADCKALAHTLQQQLIKPIVGFNFGWDKPLPWIKFAYEQEEDLETLSTVYKNLAAIGMPLTQEHISERFGVPLPQADQKVLHPVPGALGTKMSTYGLKVLRKEGAR